MLISSKPAAAKWSPCADNAHDDSKITYTLGQDKPGGWWRRPCHDANCRAIHDLACAAKALSRTFHPNTMAFKTPQEAERTQLQARRMLQRFGKGHPNRIPFYCQLLARVAPTVTGLTESGEPQSTQAGLDFNAYYLSTLAIRLDRPGNHCLTNMLAAVPHTPAAQAVMQQWAIPCLQHIKQCQAELDR